MKNYHKQNFTNKFYYMKTLSVNNEDGKRVDKMLLDKEFNLFVVEEQFPLPVAL